MAGPFGARVLVFAPHPDDEVVACAAAIGRARVAGAQVGVVFLTHGCVDQESMWPWERGRYRQAVARRRTEATRVAEELGVAIAGWSDRPARRLWRELVSAEVQLRSVLAAFQPDQIWAPAFEGGNPDHDGANALAARFATEGINVLEFAEYNFAGGKARSHRFIDPNGEETALNLTQTERERKRRLVALYASEAGNLGYVDTTREVFRPLAHYDYARAPHPGKLWYARFQWAPVPHPMIDRTAPDDVYRTISAYARRETASP